MIDLDRQLTLSSQLVRVSPGTPDAPPAAAHAKIGVPVPLGADAWMLLDHFRAPTTPRAVLAQIHVTDEIRALIERALARFVEAGLLVEPDEPRYLFEHYVALTGPHRPALRPAGAGFLGADGSDASADFRVLGVPFDRAAKIPGAARGPRGLREASQALPAHFDARSGAFRGLWDHGLGRLILAGARLADRGDVLIDATGSLAEAYAAIHAAARALCDPPGGCPVFLGGDHAISEPILRALIAARGPLFLVHFDAHTDMSPAYAGRPHHHGSVMDLARRLDGVRGVLQLGVRDLGPPWWAGAPRTDVVACDRLRDLSAEALLARIPDDVPCYVSVDVDVLDPSEAPGTGVPVPGGLRVVELERLLRVVGEGRAVAGVDLVEVAPELERGKVTTAAATRALLTLLDAVHQRQLRAENADPRSIASRPPLT